jgi:FlaG/FlaF family flagellin (archaellin)
LEAIMAIFLLIAIAAVVLAAVIATLVQVARDGYRAVPTRAELPRLSDFSVRSEA